MKLTIKPDNEKKMTYVTYVIDWNEPNANEKLIDLVNGKSIDLVKEC